MHYNSVWYIANLTGAPSEETAKVISSERLLSPKNLTTSFLPAAALIVFVRALQKFSV